MDSNSAPRRTLVDRLNGTGTKSSTVTPQSSSRDTVQSSSFAVSGGPLNNARTDVISTLETLPDSTVKYLFRLIYISMAMGFVGLAFLLVSKLGRQDYLRGESVLIWNAVIASGGLCVLGACMLSMCHRLYIVNSRRLKWSARRRKGATLFMIELITQFVNLCFYLVPNVYLLVNECGWDDDILVWTGFIRMTCWNTIFLVFLIISHNTNLIEGNAGRADGAVFDSPLSYHAPKLIIWFCIEGVLVAIWIRSVSLQIEDASDSIPYCTGNDFDCSLDIWVGRMTYVVAFFFLVYFIGSIIFIRIGFQQLKEKQYLHFRMANIQLRLQSRFQMVVHSFHALSFILLWFVNMDSCESVVLSWLGLLPSQFAMTVAIFVKFCLMKPVKPTQEDYTLETWLREFAWSEDEVPTLIRDRGNGCCLKTAPLFCFETALKTFYWSALMYTIKQEADSQYSLQTAMRLYELEHYELFHEELHDTKLIVAYNDSVVLLAFRGTSSLKNVLADLQISRIIHPPIRGNYMSRPRVHRGFLETWYSNGLNNRVMELVQRIRDGTNQRVILTGHSLGGALATLAAYDLQLHASVPSNKIECYTFGAPRVGNYPFAYDYCQRVPNTWNVINDQDYITRTMKFVNLYKRPGHRVIINGQGDMLVRPSFIEMTLSRITGAVNIAHHMLASYQNAFLAIARSQFNPDGIEGGAEQMLKISNTLQEVLGVTKTRLIRELNWGDRLKELEKKKKSEQQRFKIIQRSLEFIIDSGRDFTSLISSRFQSAAKWRWTPSKRSQMEGIDPSKMQI
eukprot:g8038.t1